MGSKKILTRTILEYVASLTFPNYYDRIKRLIDSADYVVGHTLKCDAKALNDECQRYDMPSLDYVFYDVKIIYKDYSNTCQEISVGNILKKLNIVGEENTHDAETDAYNTMLGLKTMLETLNVTFDEIAKLCPNSKDKTQNYIVESIEKNKIRREIESKNNINGDGTNDIKKGSVNRRIYHQFLNNVKPNKEGRGIFKNKKVSISINYEEHHFR